MEIKTTETAIFHTLNTINENVTDIKEKVSTGELTKAVVIAFQYKEELEKKKKIEAQENARKELYERDLVNEFIIKKYGVEKKGTEKKSDKPKQAKSITGLFLEFIGDKPILDITKEDVSEWYDNMLDEDKTTLTIDTYRKMMKALFDYIMDEQEKLNVKVVPQNYFAKVIVTPLRVTRSALTDAQTIEFIDMAALAGKRTNPVFGDVAFFAEMLVGTGMRPGELLRVRVRDFEFKDKTILIPETKTDLARMVVYPSIMQPRIIRWIKEKGLKLDDRLIDYKYDTIRGYFKRIANAVGIEIKSRSKMVTVKDEKGNPVIDKATGQPLKTQAIETIKPHMLRHTFDSNLLNNKVPAEWVAKQMGHTTGSQTVTTYFDVDLQALLKELDKYTPLNRVKELKF
jgi:integrase